MWRVLRQTTLIVAIQGIAVGAVRADEVITSAAEPTEVVITAEWLGTPTEASVRNHPGARNVVTAAELNESGARSLEDALRRVPGVTVFDESGTGVLPNIGVRGLNPLRSEQVLVLVDGIPATLAPYGQTGLSLFPVTPETVEAIDVARGGVAVHYGPNNVGGVINFITKQIPARTIISAKETATIANGNVLSDTYARIGGAVSDALKLQLQANATDGQAERAHSDTNILDVKFDADWRLGERSALKGGLQYYDTENDLPGALTPAAYAQDRMQSTRPLDRFNGDTLRAHAIFEHEFEDGAALRWATFGHHSNRQFFFGNSTNASTPSTLQQSSPREFHVYGTEPKVTFTLDGAVPQTFSAGVRFMREEVDYKVDSRNLASGAYSVTRDWRFETNAYAAYVSDTLAWLDGRLEVTPGVRTERIDLSYRNNQTAVETQNRTTDWLPGVDVGYRVTEAIFLFANFHQSLRPVQFTQITTSGERDVERAKNYEAGVRLSPTRAFDASVAAFHFQFDNKLEFVNATVGFRNLGKARHEGIETELSWRPDVLEGWELAGSYTYTDAEQLSGAARGKELPYAPHHQATLQSRLRLSHRWQWSVSGVYQSESFSDGANTPIEDAAGSVGPIPSYTVWNTQLTYTSDWHEARVAVALNNLFDRDYYFRGVDFSQGRMPAPGRAVLARLQMEW